MLKQCYFLNRFSKEIHRFFVVVLLMSGFITSAFAEDVGGKGLIGNLVGQKVIVDPKSGREVMLPATDVTPGDMIEYALTYQNHEMNNAMKAIVIATPIPNETAWVIGSAATEVKSLLEASIDGGKQYQEPPVRIKTRGSAGKDIFVLAPASAYTNLRWTLSQPLSPGEAVLVKYRVVVK